MHFRQRRGIALRLLDQEDILSANIKRLELLRSKGGYIRCRDRVWTRIERLMRLQTIFCWYRYGGGSIFDLRLDLLVWQCLQRIGKRSGAAPCLLWSKFFQTLNERGLLLRYTARGRPAFPCGAAS